MIFTFERITNGYVLYAPVYMFRNYEAVQTGTSREYFPTLDLLFRKMAQLLNHEMPEAIVKPVETK